MWKFPEWVDAHVLAHYRRQPKFDCGNDRPRLGLDPLASGVHVSPKSLDEVVDEQLARKRFLTFYEGGIAALDALDDPRR